MSEGTPPTVLRVRLPGVVSWSRPRRMRGGVRYPAAYARARDAWSLLVAAAVRDARWRPPPVARYRVAVATYGGGKRDLDRVCTAVLDALQAGGAVRDDCLVDALRAARLPLPRGAQPATEAALTALPAAPPRVPARAAPAEAASDRGPSEDGTAKPRPDARAPGRVTGALRQPETDRLPVGHAAAVGRVSRPGRGGRGKQPP
jgi:Holliday junction resolvase RusA-like endonuclease